MIRPAWIMCALLALLAACSPASAAQAPLVLSTETASATATALSSATPLPIFTPTPASSSTPTPTFSPTGTISPPATPTFTSTRVPLSRIRLLSYNLLYGAGVERQFDSALPSNLAGTSRLPELLSYVKRANPDIWAVQEANGWERGTPPLIDQVAQELNMHAVLMKSPGGFHLGLLTKFDILDTRDLSADVGRQGALRATLRTPRGDLLTVFVVHLDPATSEARLCEIDTLAKEMEPYRARQALIMGDMNFAPASREYARLVATGWKPVTIEQSMGIDQIWASPGVEWSTTDWFQSLIPPSAISDHNPIGAELDLYSGSVVVPTLAPRSPTPAAALPSWALGMFANARIVQSDDLNSSCAFSRWASRWKTEKLSNGVLEIAGEAPWQASASPYKLFTPGQGVLLRFQFARGSEFEMSFDNGLWNSDQYRRFGFNLRPDATQAVVWQGAAGILGESLKGNLYPQPDTWYDLLLILDRQGEFSVELRDPREPKQSLAYRGHLDGAGGGTSWTFGIGADKGKLLVDEFAEIELGQ